MVRVAWVPGWYELDPQLAVGLEAEFAFWRHVPEHLCGLEEFVLYNYLRHPEDELFASGKITAIRHPELGEIRKVDTCGLDYTITLADGTEIVVNAEEDPGKMFEGKPGAWVESKGASFPSGGSRSSLNRCLSSLPNPNANAGEPSVTLDRAGILVLPDTTFLAAGPVK